jgi:hypothetical protein
MLAGQTGPDFAEVLVRLYLCPSYDVTDLVTKSLGIYYCPGGTAFKIRRCVLRNIIFSEH